MPSKEKDIESLRGKRPAVCGKPSMSLNFFCYFTSLEKRNVLVDGHENLVTKDFLSFLLQKIFTWGMALYLNCHFEAISLSST